MRFARPDLLWWLTAVPVAAVGLRGGLQVSIDKLNSFWATTKFGVGEALSPLIGKLAELAESALPWLQEMFTKAQPIIAAFSEELGGKLGPAAMIIMDAFNRIGESLGITNEEFSGMDMLLGLLKVSLDLIVTAVETLAVGLSLLADAVEWVAKPWRDLMNLFDNTEVPEVLEPGSPTPLEIGLRGIASAIDSLPDFASKFEMNVELIGVQAARMPSFHESWRQGKKVTVAPAETVADGLAARSVYEIPFMILQNRVKDVVLLSEEELLEGVRLALRYTQNLAEVAGAASLAAAFKIKQELAGKNVVLIMTGGNLGMNRLSQILQG